MKEAIAFMVLALAFIVVSAGYYDTTRHNDLLPKDKWTCVATFKDDGYCAAYASNKLIELAKANRGPST